jgi:glucosamine--fructose-6-phosphate aminotransferase (isomerizing)
MSEPRLLQDIRNEPQSLAHVLSHQFGEGYGALLEAARCVLEARKVVITGMGASLFAAYPLQYELAAMGIHSMVIESGELLHYQQRLCSHAVVLLVSRSGESIEIAKLLPLLKKISRRVIGVTNEPGSRLARDSDIVLIVGSLADELIAIQSYTGTALALMLLAGAVAGILSGTRRQIEALLSELPALIAANLEEIRSWDDFLDTPVGIHLLARGPSCASALEGALLFNETAKVQATGISSGNFRHGPVELVDVNFRGLIFAPSGGTRELNLSLAQDLLRFGGKVRVIGPADALCGTLPHVEVPAVSEKFAPLAEIIPVQIAALRLAQLNGLPLGKFRHAPLVARDEATFPPSAP